jgi:predicted PurR-regulated permease PerM
VRFLNTEDERRFVATVFNKKKWFIFLIIPFLLLLLYLSRTVLSLFALAFFLAYAINPLVEFFQKKGAPRDWAILTVYLILFVAGVLVTVIIIPKMIHDLTGILQRLPLLSEMFEKLETRFSRMYWELPLNIKALLAQLMSRSEIMLRNLILKLAQGLVNFFSQSVLYLLVPLLAYYISRDYPRMKGNIQRWIMIHFGPHWNNTFTKIDTVLRLYIRGQLLDTIIVGLLIGLGLTFLGSDIAFLLGLVAAFFNLIPYFGPLLGAVPSVLFAFLQSPWLALYVIILFLVVNQIEVMFLAPKIIGGSLGLHPVLVVYLILVAGKLFGLFGLVFAVPLGAILLIILTSIYQLCFGMTNRDSP